MVENKQKLLIVDDQKLMRELLQAFLKGLAEIELAESGEEALEKISQNKPDLVLLDVTMPGMDGYEVCKKIKADPELKDIHIIFMTGRDTNEDEVRGLDEGATDFIKKPPVPQVVYARVRNTLKLQAMTNELIVMARTDPLTGTFNRRHFIETGDAEIKRSVRYEAIFSMMMLDIDHFKNVNDTYGHDVGDVAIKATVKAIQEALRTEDTLGRLGGEEFAVILPETNLDNSAVVAERIRQSIEDIDIPTPQGDLKFTISIGISELDIGDKAIDTLLKRADEALYIAKEQGRNRVIKAK